MHAMYSLRIDSEGITLCGRKDLCALGIHFVLLFLSLLAVGLFLLFLNCFVLVLQDGLLSSSCMPL